MGSLKACILGILPRFEILGFFFRVLSRSENFEISVSLGIIGENFGSFGGFFDRLDL